MARGTNRSRTSPQRGGRFARAWRGIGARRALRWGGLVGAIASACARQPELTPGRCCGEARDGAASDAPSDPRAGVVATDGAALAPGRASSAAPRALRADSCAREIVVTGTPAANLQALAAACAQGLSPSARDSARDAAVRDGRPPDLVFTVPENRCVRALGASDGPALTITLTDDSGKRLAEGAWGEAVAVAPPQGPVCFRAATRLHVGVASAASATVVAELYQSAAP